MSRDLNVRECHAENAKRRVLPQPSSSIGQATATDRRSGTTDSARSIHTHRYPSPQHMYRSSARTTEAAQNTNAHAHTALRPQTSPCAICDAIAMGAAGAAHARCRLAACRAAPFPPLPPDQSGGGKERSRRESRGREGQRGRGAVICRPMQGQHGHFNTVAVVQHHMHMYIHVNTYCLPVRNRMRWGLTAAFTQEGAAGQGQSRCADC